MNMKRRLVLSLCAVALTAFGMSSAQAVVDVALNLRYTDPADPSEGGTWTLVAKTNTASSQGIVGLVVRFAASTMPAAGTVNGSIGHDINGEALKIGQFDHDSDANTPTQTEFVYGQDPNGSIPGYVVNVGLNGGPSDQNLDPLHNPVWDDASIIATGAIANLTTRPSIFSAEANERIGGVVTAATINLTNVRGDSVSVDGLQIGDLERDFDVDSTDLGNLLNFFGSAPGTRPWDQGDVEGDDGDVDSTDLGNLLNFFGSTQTVPPLQAVPEPTALALAMLGVGLLAGRMRR
jgi:hypothetical protein